MYSGVPTISPRRVRPGAASASVSLAMPKSITLTRGSPAGELTRTLPGLRSRWRTPFWWACWTASHTCRKRRIRSAVVRRCSSQNRVIGLPGTSSITRKGRPSGAVPASSTWATDGWLIRASVPRSVSKRSRRRSPPRPLRTSLRATRRASGASCSASNTTPIPPRASSRTSRYGPSRSPAAGERSPTSGSTTPWSSRSTSTLSLASRSTRRVWSSGSLARSASSCTRRSSASRSTSSWNRESRR